ncbi:DoxX family protein [Streptomyces sp. JJ36]|uniref:DoxX family protein n=1 Tax=Streptomyces sp. JJ36 TaxID=2736645 RepID=UPI001F37FAEC|nr:DoxX family protein [Streptomyces sp. JJ36]MCF6525172.1 DoxX family protein [Streptomyces sp. JJ36]
MILRRIARPLLAAIFVSGGINALRQTEGHAKAVQPFLDRTVGRRSEDLPDAVPTDPETLVRIDAVLKLGGGVALAFGWAPRVAATVLLGTLVSTTAAAHRFWEEEDEGTRNDQLIHFLKNAGLAGGLLLAVADTEGKPSVAWRARHTAQLTSRQLSGTTRTAQRKAQKNVRQMQRQSKDGVRRARKAVRR